LWSSYTYIIVYVGVNPPPGMLQYRWGLGASDDRGGWRFAEL